MSGKRGAPQGNRNAMKSGLRSILTTGRYPRGATYVARLVAGLRSELEIAILSLRPSAEVHEAALCQSAARHEARALLLQRMLRDKQDELTTDQKLSILRDMSAATDARDRCIKQLNLDPRQQSAGDYLDMLTPEENCFLPNDSSEEKISGESQQGDGGEREAAPSEK